MYGKKLPVESYRKGPRLEFPDYSGREWTVNKEKWDNPTDTFSVPTGMFKDDPDCAERDVTFMASIYNNLGSVMPRRRNMEIVRGDDWQVDAKVVVTSVACSADSLEYSVEDEAAAGKCIPDPDYMKDNPVRAVLYHFEQSRARLTRRLLGTWFSDNDRVVGGVEVRHCVWWNENFGSSGAWDPSGCTLVETDAEKTKCECHEFGSMTVLLERTTVIDIEDDCDAMMLVKYVGIGFSVFFLTVMAFGIILGKDVWDMFHALRLHAGLTWSTAIILHVLTDFEPIREDPELNLIFGFIMKFFYTASVTWTTLEAHATFRAFTAGIVSGRNGVYRPFGYGTPFLPLGLLFLFYTDDLGVDPRCFVGWNMDAKLLYLLYNVGVAATGCVFSIIIMFNLARPQTKRRNLVADLNSQAKGTVIMCFSKLIFWILATVTYTFNQENDYEDPYCLFILLLGWFGVWMFVVLALGSQKFRAGVTRSRKERLENEETVTHFDSIGEGDADTIASDVASVTSRPASGVSAGTVSRPATAVSQISRVHEEDETDEHDSNNSGSDVDDGESSNNGGD